MSLSHSTKARRIHAERDSRFEQGEKSCYLSGAYEQSQHRAKPVFVELPQRDSATTKRHKTQNDWKDRHSNGNGQAGSPRVAQSAAMRKIHQGFHCYRPSLAMPTRTGYRIEIAYSPAADTRDARQRAIRLERRHIGQESSRASRRGGDIGRSSRHDGVRVIAIPDNHPDIRFRSHASITVSAPIHGLSRQSVSFNCSPTADAHANQHDSSRCSINRQRQQTGVVAERDRRRSFRFTGIRTRSGQLADRLPSDYAFDHFRFDARHLLDAVPSADDRSERTASRFICVAGRRMRYWSMNRAAAVRSVAKCPRTFRRRERPRHAFRISVSHYCALLPSPPNPVEFPVPRASYNGHYLSFPSPSALIKTTIHAPSHVVFPPESTKNRCSCGAPGDASFHASANLKKLTI
ncbi:hypothetical protein [Burkholderia thailandensis]|uniref:hypothetical protein n=1 Tax=Burkholderia thailandensis TaxID=57975 RepID=UPI0012B51636|nr:hypothetical protein [Burkholderia thailandensis]MCS3398646.1 hypothetical protein [Burkholderia thailandensis]MCS6475059.1 hypothetical protein [Burkholderia thailandensis]MCS6497829.1 hypothetical protein [Burkholderia thailandensis]MUV22011.1 hypothetical protein [Burkholderia thailandensis]NOK45885.1 hypothetical protein [Burkholderia thailandensis]